MSKYIDLTGQKFNRLTVVSRVKNIRTSDSMWKCVCDCGNTKIATGSNIRLGKTQSCGCLHSEIISKTMTTHGLSETPEYKIWCKMKSRCNVKERSDFYRYGGRGISVCNRWINSFECFISDMGNRPTQKHSIDRINNNGNYAPDNCKWSTPKEQANNRRSNRFITAFGKTLTLSMWSKEIGIPSSVLYDRHRRGWSVSRMLTEKVK